MSVQDTYIDIYYVYFIKPEEIGALKREFDRNYDPRVCPASNAKIKLLLSTKCFAIQICCCDKLCSAEPTPRELTAVLVLCLQIRDVGQVSHPY